MRNMKRLLLALAALTLALTAAPAAAQVRFEFGFPPPPPPQYCFVERGHWMWDGFQYVWVPTHTVCRYP